MKASDLLGRRVRDRNGKDLGQIADLLAHPDADGNPRISAALVTPRHRGRLLGYERPGIQGPWILERIADWLHRGIREVPWDELEEPHG